MVVEDGGPSRRRVVHSATHPAVEGLDVTRFALRHRPPRRRRPRSRQRGRRSTRAFPRARQHVQIAVHAMSEREIVVLGEDSRDPLTRVGSCAEVAVDRMVVALDDESGSGGYDLAANVT